MQNKEIELFIEENEISIEAKKIEKNWKIKFNMNKKSCEFIHPYFSYSSESPNTLAVLNTLSDSLDVLYLNYWEHLDKYGLIDLDFGKERYSNIKEIFNQLEKKLGKKNFNLLTINLY